MAPLPAPERLCDMRVVPPTPTISKIESNFNSFRSAISRAARRSRASPAGVSSWYYVFEDDIGIVNRSTVAHEMEQARERDPCLCPGQPDDHPLSQAEARAERLQLEVLPRQLRGLLGLRLRPRPRVAPAAVAQVAEVRLAGKERRWHRRSGRFLFFPTER